MRRLAREHRAFVAILFAAFLVRLGMAIAYGPALTFVDSWGYIDAAYSAFPFEFAYERPSGYPFLLHLIALPGRSLVAITTLQHLAGLATGVLLYALLLRLDVRRGVAVAVAAVVLLDGYAITLEQHVLSEAFFTLAVVGCIYLTVGERGPGGLAGAGALLALAAATRPAALAAIPVWLAYVTWTRRRLVPIAAAATALALPLVAYSAYHAADTGVFGITEQDGWFLYGRVAPVADCEGADIPEETRPLCEPDGRQQSIDPDFYVWNDASPARRHFGGAQGERLKEVNLLLRDFALAVIRAHPGAYAEAVADDLLQIVTPGDAGLDITIKPPEAGDRHCRDCDGVNHVVLREAVRDRWFPGYEPEIRAPAGAAVRYAELVHTPRWLVGALLVIALLAVAVAAVPRYRAAVPRRREVFLLAGMAAAMLVATVATVNPNVRYLVPLSPLAVGAGVLLLPPPSQNTPRVQGSSSSGSEGSGRPSQVSGVPPARSASSRQAGLAKPDT